MIERSDIAELARRLGDPDEAVRDRASNRLEEMGSDAVDPLAANLRVVDTAARPQVVRVLRAIGDDRALVPLMRYVFDTRGEPDESDARAIAMQAILEIGLPDHRERIGAFLRDVRDDSDPHVRGYAAEGLGRTGDPLVKPYLEAGLEDDERFVRQRARSGREKLDASDRAASPREGAGDELLDDFRRADGVDRRYFAGEIRARDDAFDLAARMVRTDVYDSVDGLRLLQRIDDPRAREVAVTHSRRTESETDRAAALQILAEHLAGDASQEERDVVESGLESRDDFVRSAARAAAGASGVPGLIRRALTAIASGAPGRADRIARAVAAGGLDRGSIPKALDTLDDTHRRRLGADGRRRSHLIRSEAHLLRALAHSADQSPQPRRLALAALQSLEGAADDRPILVAGFELLETAVPDDGFDEDRRIRGAHLEPLLELTQSTEADVRDRALAMIARLAAADEPALISGLEDAIYADPRTVAEWIVPLLERADNERARQLLAELSETADEPARTAAARALDGLDAGD